MMWDYMNIQMTLGHGVGMIFLWIFIFVLIIYFVSNNQKNEQSALDIIKKRFAKGEITEEEFQKLKNIIKEY